MKLSELVQKYIEIRDQKLAIKQEYDAKIAKRDEALNKIEAKLLEVFEQTGMDSVKTEFGKFGDVLAKTRKKLEEATNTIDSAEVRTRALTRKLKELGMDDVPE